MIKVQFKKEDNTTYSVMSEYVKVPEYQNKSFVVTGFEILCYSTGEKPSLNFYYDIDYKGEDTNVGSPKISNKIQITFATPLTPTYIRYKIECTNIIIKDIVMTGFITEYLE